MGRTWQGSTLLIVMLAVAGCDGGPVVESPKNSPPLAPSPVSLPIVSGPVEGADEERVLAACSRCHSPPPFDVLPRSAWKNSVMTMLSLSTPFGVAPLTREEAALAIAWYEERSPEKLDPPPAIARDGKIIFEGKGFTPRGLEKEMIPAVAHLLLFDVT
ncbi:MAG TPA: hypothetical protein EYN79_02135, partial [Planctomycetes bacterium]|nr:hypothetical protein [Planctomycetota bacterium]